MNVILEAIQFNHVRDSATVDAFNIRRNETEPVHVPEWRKRVSVKPEDSPAAYARDEIAQNMLTIKAKFTCSDEAVTSVWVQALDGHLNTIRSGKGGGFRRFALRLLRPFLRRALPVNVLGKVLMTEVPLKKGQSEFVLFKLADIKISEAGVSVSDIIWRWQFSVNARTWTDFATSNPTMHRIYTVLKMPKAPWQPESTNSSNTQQPWTEVLDYACQWAASATDVPQAATLVTHSVNGLGVGLVHYDNHHSGSTGFTIDSPPSFDCADFLLLLRGQKNKHGSGVNCDDCAAVVASFANILGSDLFEAQMDNDFPLNSHQLIGASNQVDSFAYHTVAWSGNCGEEDELFDACVQLDSDDDPAQPPHPLFVPTNIRFGRRDERHYRFRLASDQDQCNPVQGSALRRRIGFPKHRWDLVAPNTIMALKEKRYDEQSASSRVVNLLFSNIVSGGTEFILWRLQDLYLIEDSDSLLSAQSFWMHKDNPDVAIRIDAQAFPFVHGAHNRLKKLLSRFQLRQIKQQEHPEFGDSVYAVPTNFVILFSRREFVFRIRNVGREVVSCASFARAIDAFLMSQLQSNPNATQLRMKAP